MIQSIFYQILEYVIAPIGLMIFTFFVKGKNTKELRVLRFSDNAIESLFIASYCHLLYYFSLTAHEHHMGVNTCRDDQFASLMNAIAGLLTIFIFKYFYEKLDGWKLEKLKGIVNGTAMGLMIILTAIIIDSNMNYAHHRWTWSPNDAWKIIAASGAFLIHLNNLIFIPFIGFILYLIIVKPIIQVNPSLKSYINTTKNVPEEISLRNYTSIADDTGSPDDIRISSFVKIANHFFTLKKYEEALAAITNAKKLSVSTGNPEAQLIAIRVLKARIHCLLRQPGSASQEKVELEESKTLATEENKEFFDLWLKKLDGVLQQCA